MRGVSQKRRSNGTRFDTWSSERSGRETSTVAVEAGDVDVTPTISGEDFERLQGRDDIRFTRTRP